MKYIEKTDLSRISSEKNENERNFLTNPQKSLSFKQVKKKEGG